MTARILVKIIGYVNKIVNINWWLSPIICNYEEPSFFGNGRYGLNVSMAFFSQESAQNLDYGRTVWDEVRLAGMRSNDQERRNLLSAFLFSGDAGL